MQNNTLSLGDRVMLIDYRRKNPGVGTRRIVHIYCTYTISAVCIKITDFGINCMSRSPL